MRRRWVGLVEVIGGEDPCGELPPVAAGPPYVDQRFADGGSSPSMG